MLPKTFSPKLEKALIIVLFFLIAIGLIWQVINLSHFVPLHDWDEAIYAQVAKEWAQSPSFTLHYNGVVWFEKPLIPFVIMGALWSLFGPSIVPLRMVSAILGAFSLFFVYWITKKITGKNSTGVVAVVAYISSGFFLDRSSIVNVDIYLTLAWLLYIISDTFGLRVFAIILGVGSKSLLGFIPLILDATYALFTKKLSVHKIMEYLVQIGIGSVWYVIIFSKFGSLFVQSHFLDHLVSRLTKPIELHFGDKLFYFAKIIQDMGVWGILALIGVVLISWSLIQKKPASKGAVVNNTKLKTMIVIIPLVYLTLLTMGQAKLTWYVMPIIPFIAILSAFAIQRIQSAHTYLQWTSPVIILVGCFLFAHHIVTQNFQTYQIPDKTKLALCIEEILRNDITTPIAYLVSPQEREDARVIEAAKLHIGSSFIYGSAPAFVFYSDRPVSFYYSREALKEKGLGHSTIVVHEDDLANSEITRITRTWNANTQDPACISGPWQAFIRDY